MIDHGMNNWLTCVSNAGASFIVDGKHLKSINQGYNKRVAALMEGQANGYWSKRLARITEKRNRVMRDDTNKATRQVINHGIEHRIGTVIFGWNKGQKYGIDLGCKTNQKIRKA
jgi:putative transposase